MITWMRVAPHMELSLGSLRLLNLMGMSIVFTSLAFVGVDIAFPGLFHCSVGLSGVLFTLVTVDILILRSGVEVRPFNLFPVPAQYFPWLLLICTQFLLPNISFATHLCGLLVGLLYNTGRIDFLLVPSSRFAPPPNLCLRWIEPERAEDIETGAAVNTTNNLEEGDTLSVALRTLVEMGFDRNTALSAMRRNGNLLSAIEELGRGAGGGESGVVDTLQAEL